MIVLMVSQLSKIKSALRENANADKAKIYQRFFKTGPGQYGVGDLFLGVTVPKQRIIAKQFTDLALSDLRQLLASKIHEERCTSLIILVSQFNKADQANKIKLAKFYLKNLRWVNNWDLVDGSAPKILGPYLEIIHRFKFRTCEAPSRAVRNLNSIIANKFRTGLLAKFGTVPQPQAQYDLLTKLAHSKNLWHRRIAILTTFHFIKKSQPQETLRLAKILLTDKEDLTHKAVGWMLREVGKQYGQEILERFLHQHKNQMPRTMLRYAIERLPADKRKFYSSNLNLGK